MTTAAEASHSSLSPGEHAAMVMVSECFGSASPELLAFTRFLVERQGLVWLQDSPPKEGE